MISLIFIWKCPFPSLTSSLCQSEIQWNILFTFPFINAQIWLFFKILSWFSLRYLLFSILSFELHIWSITLSVFKNSWIIFLGLMWWGMNRCREKSLRWVLLFWLMKRWKFHCTNSLSLFSLSLQYNNFHPQCSD
jgi:hypothetical protein